MIRLACPGCHKTLAIPDTLAGRLVACPKCKNKFRVPQPEPADPDDEAEVQVTARPRPGRSAPSRPAPPARPRRPAEEEDEQPVRRRPRPAEEEEDDLEEAPAPSRRRAEEDDEEGAPRRRERKKRRRTRPSRPREGMDPMLMGAIGVGGVCLLLGLGALLLPWLALVPICLGAFLYVAGYFWFIVVAFQDDVIQGILVFFVPFYFLYYLIVNWEGEKKPFLCSVAGFVLVMFGSCMGSMGNAIRGGPALEEAERPATWVMMSRSTPG
jgi:hypothetical protein